MKMFYKVTVDILWSGRGGMYMRRTFSFARREEAEAFAKLIEQRSDVTLAGTSIDHLMEASEALYEVDEEMDMSTRVAHSGAK